MDPPRRYRRSSGPRFPRTRGDGPVDAINTTTSGLVSPHTRGWTLASRRVPCSGAGFPAHAGMDRSNYRDGLKLPRFPRTRGDGPATGVLLFGGYVVSPHTRGWTRLDLHPRPVRNGFPAHAGMDPAPPPAAPRTARFPRTRGDGPRKEKGKHHHDWVSPHTRGWTSVSRLGPGHAIGFPAHAGMDPTWYTTSGVYERFPRTRGDGPLALDPEIGRLRVSPHTRGWTSSHENVGGWDGGFPAHAGMDPSMSSWPKAWHRFPRTRGDGPSVR